MKAWNLTRKEIYYRHDAFSAGLRAVGFDVQSGAVPSTVNPGDLVLSWNRYSDNDAICTRVERAGGIAVICENGYVGPGGVSPHHMEPRSVYALARGWHNDGSVIPEASPDRWNALGVDLAPWRADGGHILIAPNRSFGAPGRMMPPDWGNDVAKRIAKVTKREVRIRPHPGNHAPKKPLAEDLAGAWVCCIWSSSAGVHSLIAGVPVICEAPYWICKDAAFVNYEEFYEIGFSDNRPIPREHALHRLAHGQFNLAEIESGEAFRRVLA